MNVYKYVRAKNSFVSTKTPDAVPQILQELAGIQTAKGAKAVET